MGCGQQIISLFSGRPTGGLELKALAWGNWKQWKWKLETEENGNS